MTRAKIEIDAAEVERLAGLGLSQADICAQLGISEDTLTRRKKDTAVIAEAIKRGKVAARVKVGSGIMEKIEAGDLAAMIWFEKTRLGYSDKQQVEHSGKLEIEYVNDWRGA